MLQDSEPEVPVIQPPGLLSPGMSLNASRAKCYDGATDGGLRKMGMPLSSSPSVQQRKHFVRCAQGWRQLFKELRCQHHSLLFGNFFEFLWNVLHNQQPVCFCSKSFPFFLFRFILLNQYASERNTLPEQGIRRLSGTAFSP